MVYKSICSYTVATDYREDKTMAKRKINITAIKSLKSGETLWDTELRGFGCRCQKSGKFFMLKYSLNGRQRFYTIGEWNGSLTPDQAREQAEILRGQIRSGIDPMAEKERDKAIPFVKDAFEKYLEEIKEKRSPRTHAEYKRLFVKLATKPIGRYQLNSVSRADIARLHNGLKATPYQANRLLAVLSSFFSWSIKQGHRTNETNPCRYIDRFKEKSRERFLSEEELYALGQALIQYEEEHKFLKKQLQQKKNRRSIEENTVTPAITAAIRLLLLTGARVNEILTLQWKDINFKLKMVRLQESKTGQKTIYLSAPTLQLLLEIPRIKDNPYVICGKNKGSHLINIKDPWNTIRKSAGLEDVRLHDLRHNYASTAVTTGHHLKVIGSLLGHKNTKTTERYAHLANDPLQTANETISNRILNAITTKPQEDNIIKIYQGQKD